MAEMKAAREPYVLVRTAFAKFAEKVTAAQ
jgi:hypothetical protein